MLRAGPFDVEWTGCKENSEYGKKNAQSDNKLLKLLRNCLIVPFVKKWTFVGTWMDVPTSVHFFPNRPPKQLLLFHQVSRGIFFDIRLVRQKDSLASLVTLWLVSKLWGQHCEHWSCSFCNFDVILNTSYSSDGLTNIFYFSVLDLGASKTKTNENVKDFFRRFSTSIRFSFKQLSNNL